jgi:hypothetical protein
MSKTIAERLKELAEMISQKADEIRNKTQGVDVNGNSGQNKATSK